MKISVVILVILLTCNSLLAQIGGNITNTPPIIPEKSVLFANDIFINNQPSQDQRNIAICSAFNGWLYASYIYPVNNQPKLELLRSKDNGKTWSIIIEGLDGYFGDYFIKTDLIACGNDTTNLKLFFGEVKYHANSGYRTVAVTRFNCSTGLFEQSILDETTTFNANDIALATDYLYPSTNANPYSIAAIYSKELMYPTFRDTVILATSSNGGASLFDCKVGVGGSALFLNKVAIAHGRTSNFPEGRYFVAWEEKANSSSIVGHIYTAHSNPYYNSPTTLPHLLDNNAAFSNKLRNPAIACQFNNVNNDSSNLTEVVLCEKYLTSEQRADIIGFYNKTAATSNNFSSFPLTNVNNNLQSDIAYNTFDQTFMATYFDSTNQKLPFLTNNYNLQNPNTWNVISSGYNDSTNLKSPYPKIKLDLGEQLGFNYWIADRSNGNGAAMFDAPFNYPVGISENKISNVKIYPNPSNGNFTIENIPEDQPLFIYDMTGKIVLYRITTEKRMNLNLNVPGVYFLKTGDFKTKVVIEKE